jgi:hypothetical protein
MRRVALLSRDDMLINRIRAAVADMAQILPLDPEPPSSGRKSPTCNRISSWSRWMAGRRCPRCRRS